MLPSAQAHRGKAHAPNTASAGPGGPDADVAGEGSPGDSAAEGSSGSDSGGASGIGTDSEGDSDVVLGGQRRRRRNVSKEEAWRHEFVDPYQRIVWEVLDSMLLVRPRSLWTCQRVGAADGLDLAAASGLRCSLCIFDAPAWHAPSAAAVLYTLAGRQRQINERPGTLPLPQPLDADTMKQLGRQAKKHSQQLLHAVGGKRRRRGSGPADGAASSAAPEKPLLPSVLTRPSIERAASLLHMEAELRGRPELQALLQHSGWAGKVAPAFRHAGDGGDGDSLKHSTHLVQQDQEQQQAADEEAQHQLGRHSLHHTLWQRLERAAGVSGDSRGSGAQNDAVDSNSGSTDSSGEQAGGAADVQADAPDAAPLPDSLPESLPRKLRKRRALSPEERLVLGILSDPRFDYQGHTRLPPAMP